MKIWIHKNCGGEVESYLGYSDAYKDYYFPLCIRCKREVKMRECELKEESN